MTDCFFKVIIDFNLRENGKTIKRKWESKFSLMGINMKESIIMENSTVEDVYITSLWDIFLIKI